MKGGNEHVVRTLATGLAHDTPCQQMMTRVMKLMTSEDLTNIRRKIKMCLMSFCSGKVHCGQKFNLL